MRVEYSQDKSLNNEEDGVLNAHCARAQGRNIEVHHDNPRPVDPWAAQPSCWSAEHDLDDGAGPD